MSTTSRGSVTMQKSVRNSKKRPNSDKAISSTISSIICVAAANVVDTVVAVMCGQQGAPQTQG